MTVIIAFGHEKRVGKDTATKLLRSHLRLALKNSNIQTHGFADKVYDLCYQLYAWAGFKTKAHYEEFGEEKEIILPKLGKSPRRILIEYATHVARVVYPDTWVDYIYNRIECDICLITDLRFPNEADRIHAHGGYVYKVERPSIPHTSDDADDPLLNYPNWDGVLLNDGSLGDFNKKIVALGDRLILQLKKGVS